MHPLLALVTELDPPIRALPRCERAAAIVDVTAALVASGRASPRDADLVRWALRSRFASRPRPAGRPRRALDETRPTIGQDGATPSAAPEGGPGPPASHAND